MAPTRHEDEQEQFILSLNSDAYFRDFNIREFDDSETVPRAEEKKEGTQKKVLFVCAMGVFIFLCFFSAYNDYVDMYAEFGSSKRMMFFFVNACLSCLWFPKFSLMVREGMVWMFLVETAIAFLGSFHFYFVVNPGGCMTSTAAECVPPSEERAPLRRNFGQIGQLLFNFTVPVGRRNGGSWKPWKLFPAMCNSVERAKGYCPYLFATVMIILGFNRVMQFCASDGLGKRELVQDRTVDFFLAKWITYQATCIGRRMLGTPSNVWLPWFIGGVHSSATAVFSARTKGLMLICDY
jgi:hypothetical protein